MNKHLKTIKSRNERINYLSSAVSAHEHAMATAHPDHMPFIQDSIDRLDAEYKYLKTSHRWLFNFVGGGWNSVIAATQEQAIQIASEKYNPMGLDSGTLVPNGNTFRIETEEDEKRLMGAFH
jgi:hypothetical protein